jgi:hypothetical protein
MRGTWLVSIMGKRVFQFSSVFSHHQATSFFLSFLLFTPTRLPQSNSKCRSIVNDFSARKRECRGKVDIFCPLTYVAAIAHLLY